MHSRTQGKQQCTSTPCQTVQVFESAAPGSESERQTWRITSFDCEECNTLPGVFYAIQYPQQLCIYTHYCYLTIKENELQNEHLNFFLHSKSSYAALDHTL